MNGLRLLDFVVAFSRAMLWFAFAFALWKTGVPNGIRRLYSSRINLLSLVPFAARWQEEIAPEHLEMFRKARRWYLRFVTAIFAATLLKAIYFKFFFIRFHGLQ